MKTILLILLIAILSYAKAPYWVQVIAVKHPSSLTKQFLDKTRRCYKNYRIVQENGFEKVWLGKFDNDKVANNAKKFFQTCLTKNAFVVTGYINKKHKIFKPLKVKTVAVTKITKKPFFKVMKITANTVSLQINTKYLIEKKLASTQNQNPRQCDKICQKKHLRQSEIAAAIEYYKHSKYYKFNRHNISN